MTLNDLLFAVLPYVVVTVAIVVAVIRWRFLQFSVSSLSSQLLESRKLYWGSIPFHWGLSLILLGHLAALLVPSGFELWNGSTLRLYLLEATGLALAFWAAFGVLTLLARKRDDRIRRVTSPMDIVVLLVIAVQIGTGITIAIGYRWGSFWGTGVLVPYIRSLLRLQPDPSYVEPLPWLIKAHVLSFYAFVAVFSFSRLVHIITLPLQYLTRPWQKVVAIRPAPPAQYAEADRTWWNASPREHNHQTELALSSLRALENTDGPLTTEQLADHLSVARRSVRDVMAPLIDSGWVDKEPGARGRYQLRSSSASISVAAVAEAVENTNDTKVGTT